MTKNIIFTIAVLCFALALGLLFFQATRDAGADEVEIESDQPYDIILWLDGSDETMNTTHDDPDPDEQVQQKTWHYGHDVAGEALHGDFDLHENIPSSSIEGVVLMLEVQNPSMSNNAQVTFELKVNGDIIAEASADLDSGVPNGEAQSYWELEFTGAAAGKDVFTIEEGSFITLEMNADNPVQIHYGNNPDDDYFLLFNGIQYYDLDVQFFRIYEGESGVEIKHGLSNNNENTFRPNEVEDNAKVYINGSIKNSLGNYDLSEIMVEIYNPEDTKLSGDGTATLLLVNDGERYWVEFSFVWDYADINGLDDGQHRAKLTIKDNNADRETNDYKYGSEVFRLSNFGTYLELADGEESEKRASAGESLDFNFRIYNTGLEEDTFSLEWDEPNDWNVTLRLGESDVDETSLDAVATGQEPGYTTLTLNITIPETAPEERKVLTIKSESQGSGEVNRISHQLNVWVRVSAKTGVEVFFLDGEKHVYEWEDTAEKGDDKDFPFYVSNGGTGDDTFELRWEGKPADWDFWFINPDTGDEIEERTVDIPASSTMEIWFRVNPANDIKSEDMADVSLFAQPQSNPDIEESVDILIYRTLGVVVTSETNKELTPGSASTMVVWVENTGDESHIFDMSFDLPPDMTGWILSFDDETLTVEEGGEEQTTLSIQPPSDVDARVEGYSFTIRAQSQDDDDIYFELYPVVYIKAGYAFTVEAPSTSKKVDAGDRAEYAITVQNTGNVKISVLMQIDYDESDINDDWKVRFDPDPAFKVLDPDESATFILIVDSPDSAKSGEKTKVVVSVSIQEDPSIQAKIVSTETEAEKGTMAQIMDSIVEVWYFVAFAGFAVIGVIMVALRRGEDEYEDDDYDDDYADAEYDDEDEYV